MFNRRKDSDTGKDVHLLAADLVLKTKTDIDQAKEIRSWRGYRHAYGLKVRGQRTKTTGRAGKALGVKKKTLLQKPGAPAAEGGK
jgi:small subunit ribosomal protein S13